MLPAVQPVRPIEHLRLHGCRRNLELASNPSGGLNSHNRTNRRRRSLWGIRQDRKLHNSRRNTRTPDRCNRCRNYCIRYCYRAPTNDIRSTRYWPIRTEQPTAQRMRFAWLVEFLSKIEGQPSRQRERKFYAARCSSCGSAREGLVPPPLRPLRSRLDLPE